MNPFIGIAAVLVTGLAFYAQYKANVEFKKQIEFQKFENQFYEMLRLHKENVNEIEIETISGEKIKGRNAFFEMKKDFENLFRFTEYLNFSKNYELFFLGYDSIKNNIRKEDEIFYNIVSEYIKETTRQEVNLFNYKESPSELKIHKLKRASYLFRTLLSSSIFNCKICC